MIQLRRGAAERESLVKKMHARQASVADGDAPDAADAAHAPAPVKVQYSTKDTAVPAAPVKPAAVATPAAARAAPASVDDTVSESERAEKAARLQAELDAAALERLQAQQREALLRAQVEREREAAAARRAQGPPPDPNAVHLNHEQVRRPSMTLPSRSIAHPHQHIHTPVHPQHIHASKSLCKLIQSAAHPRSRIRTPTTTLPPLPTHASLRGRAMLVSFSVSSWYRVGRRVCSFGRADPALLVSR